MVEIKIQCPSCKHQITVEGKPSEKIYVTCPKCKTDFGAKKRKKV